MSHIYGVGQRTTVLIYGKPERVEVLRLHPFGTIDVERLADGRCFRVSGLSNSNWSPNYNVEGN